MFHLIHIHNIQVFVSTILFLIGFLLRRTISDLEHYIFTNKVAQTCQTNRQHRLTTARIAQANCVYNLPGACSDFFSVILSAGQFCKRVRTLGALGLNIQDLQNPTSDLC